VSRFFCADNISCVDFLIGLLIQEKRKCFEVPYSGTSHFHLIAEERNFETHHRNTIEIEKVYFEVLYSGTSHFHLIAEERSF
jgi:hypothetical protein